MTDDLTPPHWGAPIDYRAAAETIADELQGTCDSLQTALEHHEWEGYDNNSEFCAVLDSLVFECEGCSWWCEISEMTTKDDQWKCTDCEPDDEDE